MNYSYTRYWLDETGGDILSEVVGYTSPITFSEQLGAGASAYIRDIRGFARAVWQGLPIDAYAGMYDTVTLGIAAAWVNGAASCGILEDELSLEERIQRDQFLNAQRGYIFGFLEWVYAHRRDGPDKLNLDAIFTRADGWLRGWREAENFAKQMACADQKLRWDREVLRKVKQGCHDCLRYEGRIYRASTWKRYDIRPQHPDLGCRGFGACAFTVTDERCTPGRPPAMTGT